MKAKNVQALLIVSLALGSIPLACGSDKAAPNGGDAGSAASGARVSGGNGGEATGGGAGEATAGGNGEATGGTGGKATGGGSGKATGGAQPGGTSGTPGGESGVGGGSQGGGAGLGGAPDAGAAGEGGVDERTARCQRICKKAEVAMCPDMSRCVEIFCEIAVNQFPYCRPYADAYLACLDEHGAGEDLGCYYDMPAFDVPFASPCGDELRDGFDHGC